VGLACAAVHSGGVVVSRLACLVDESVWELGSQLLRARIPRICTWRERREKTLAAQRNPEGRRTWTLSGPNCRVVLVLVAACLDLILPFYSTFSLLSHSQLFWIVVSNNSTAFQQGFYSVWALVVRISVARHFEVGCAQAL
jgi:hypothetical protein